MAVNGEIRLDQWALIPPIAVLSDNAAASIISNRTLRRVTNRLINPRTGDEPVVDDRPLPEPAGP
jgi:hypothetical protein